MLVENVRAAQDVGDGRAVRARIVDHGAANCARNANGPFQAGPAMAGERTGQERQRRAGFGAERGRVAVLAQHVLVALSRNHQPAYARVRDEHVRPAPQDQVRRALRACGEHGTPEHVERLGDDERIRRATDAPRVVPCHRFVDAHRHSDGVG